MSSLSPRFIPHSSYPHKLAIDGGVTDVSLRGTILGSRSLGNASAGTDNSIFSCASSQGVDYMYVNAPAYHSVHSYKISGSGEFELIQRFDMNNMPSELVPTAGFAVSLL